ncbi:FAD:protein FMN transferase [Clostridioides mangenotii]|uniref:FAD:protein FMN transferase n=1 Tax=Metaclostridioides mangenotii TaxID=1540 RepID=UPI001C128584|nr:FAD:protein FMN transferase [Clostridioides mangenotii]MBU5307344.1 FAD:protein FMN transferase [Clostridioides mangenotii]MCR1954379.1 FAD:protein FMN transferase [Clostridioides mangenotii]
MKKRFLLILLVLFIIAYSSGCGPKDTAGSTEPVSKTEMFMGTVIKVTLYDHQSDEVMDKVFDKLKEIDDIVSVNKEGTEIDKVNKNAGVKPVKMSETSFDIISSGLKYSKFSNGGYDITVGPLVKLWSIGLPEAKVPTKDEIEKSLELIDYNKVQLNKNTKEVYLQEKGMMLDLGSIAKGYAADEAVKVLKEAGVERAIVDLGGNIFAMGSKSKDKGWTIGIQDPVELRGNALGSLEVKNKTVVTTGIYERYIEKDGIKYHHILNPETGYPYDTSISGVSIIADKSMDADALSTLIFTKGLEDGLKMVEEMENVDAVFVTNDKQVYTTSGIKGNFKLLKDDFKLVN